MTFNSFLLVFVLCIISLDSFSQDFPIPADGAQWNNSVVYLEDISYSQSVTRFETQGDTMIQGIVYSQLVKTWYAKYYRVDECSFQYREGPIYINGYAGAIRTDSNNRVFFIPPNDSTVITLYDFSLGAGDSVYINGPNYEYWAYAQRVDSTLINGVYRKKIDVIGYMDDIWIEGIGSIFGLFAPINRHWEKYSYSLHCYNENETIVYTQWDQTECNTCNIVSRIKSIRDYPEIFISPNPVVGSSVVTYPPHIKLMKINVYGLCGELKYSKSLSTDCSIVIEKEQLNPGIHFLELVDTDGNHYSRKIIVQ